MLWQKRDHPCAERDCACSPAFPVAATELVIVLPMTEPMAAQPTLCAHAVARFGRVAVEQLRF